MSGRAPPDRRGGEVSDERLEAMARSAAVMAIERRGGRAPERLRMRGERSFREVGRVALEHATKHRLDTGAVLARWADGWASAAWVRTHTAASFRAYVEQAAARPPAHAASAASADVEFARSDQHERERERRGYGATGDPRPDELVENPRAMLNKLGLTRPRSAGTGPAAPARARAKPNGDAYEPTASRQVATDHGDADIPPEHPRSARA